MSKVLKIVGKLIGGIFEWILILLILIAFGIRSTSVQTYLAQQATDFLSKELNTKIKVDKLSILFFHKVALDGVFVLDEKKDTLASISSVFVTLKSFSQTQNAVALDEVNLKGGIIKINREAETGDYNYEFLVDYFDSGPPSKKKKKPVNVTLDFLRLTQVDVQYDDFRKGYSTFGMDYDHMRFNNVFLYAGGLTTENGGVKLFVKHISLKEKSGFDLSRFSGLVTVNEEGLKFDRLIIKTPESNIHFAHLYLLMDEKDDLETFEDSVDLDVKINKSIVSLRDISYFGTALEGMTDKVTLQAEVKDKVKNLKINNLDLAFGKRSKIQGDLFLPDFREFEKAKFVEKLNYVYLDVSDVEKLKMPKDAGISSIDLGDEARRLGYFEARNLSLKGRYSEFEVDAATIKTGLGSVAFSQPLIFNELKNESAYTFNHSLQLEKALVVDSFNLGGLLNDKSFGKINGNVFLTGKINSNGNIDFNDIHGKITSFGFLGYNYSAISVDKASVIGSLVNASITINDPNAVLDFKGDLNVGSEQHYVFESHVSHANLKALGFSDESKSIFSSNVQVDIHGKELNYYGGSVALTNVFYEQGENSFKIPSIQANLNRGQEKDYLTIQSSLFSLNAEGKVDLNTVASDFQNQFATIFPALIQPVVVKQSKLANTFTYDLTLQDINPILKVFLPDFKISRGSKINGNFDGLTKDFSMMVVSPFFFYEDIYVKNVLLKQRVFDTLIEAEYKLGRFQMNDTLGVNNVSFVTNGSRNSLTSNLSWNPQTEDEAHFKWITNIKSLSNIHFDLLPSYFVINHHKWEILHESNLWFSESSIEIQDFKMKHDNQKLEVNGLMSKNPLDELKVDIEDFELNDFAVLFSLPVDLKGKLNGKGKISDPYQNLNLDITARLDSLYVNDSEVGDVTAEAKWNKQSESIDLNGDLFYKKNQTFHYDGKYFLEEDKLNFDLNFDYTNIDFANAFMDPQVVTGIRGLLLGKINISGSSSNPILQGDLDLVGGNAKVEMFGVNFSLNGKIDVGKDYIFINNMPIIDEEGNTGMVIGEVYHTDFSNWRYNFDLNLNESLDPRTNRIVKNDRFFVLNTDYREGEVYYGKAFASGAVNIAGYDEFMDIDVNLKTETGSTINFPMYGSSDLKEDEFITWKQKNKLDTVTKSKLDLTGLNLNLNFEVTPETNLKVIFNEQTNDQISARGTGNIGIKYDNIGDLQMNGIFTVKEGTYNFAMSLIKKPFDILENGTIVWTGNPYDADINLKAQTKVTANIAEIMEDINADNKVINQEVNCIVNMTEKLTTPNIAFNIEAPKASESAKAALERVKGNKDELNRQFFSLLIQKKFQPLGGSATSGAGAGFDLLASQINAALNEISGDYKISINLEGNMTTNFEKAFLDGKLIIKTSLGVENSSTNSSQNNNASNTTQNNFIGDVNIEYLLTEDGNVRASIFNESNDASVIQEKTRGHFTQGIGIQYKEEFNSFNDFKLFQRIGDVFRSEDKKKIKETKKKKRKPVPALPNSPAVTKPDEE